MDWKRLYAMYCVTSRSFPRSVPGVAIQAKNNADRVVTLLCCGKLFTYRQIYEYISYVWQYVNFPSLSASIATFSLEIMSSFLQPTDSYLWDISFYNSIAVQPLTSLDSGIPKSMRGFPNSRRFRDGGPHAYGVPKSIRQRYKTAQARSITSVSRLEAVYGEAKRA